MIEAKNEKPVDKTKLVLVPKDGLVWNPMRRYPRNQVCFCGSKQKAKRCCIPKLPAAVPPDQADMAIQYLKANGFA